MNRRPSSFRSLAAVATADSATTMSYRPYFRGGHPKFGRGYCDRPVGNAAGERPEYVSGDSNFSAVRDANSGFRPYYNAVPPPPQYFATQESYGSRPRYQQPRPPFVKMEPRPGPRPFYRPPGGPAPGPYKQLRPQQMQQQFRPRAIKPPDYREWEYRNVKLPPHCERFTVLSYNILGDYLASDHWHKLYAHIPRYMMDWNWRKKNIIFELGLWSADILCFQEVDRFQDIEAELKPHGYSGVWKMRTGDPVDGCAIFWRASRFKLIYEESIEYIKLGLRDNVAQICVFESLIGQKNKSGASTSSASSESSRVVVCNIHVLFNPKRGDIKLGQIRVLLEKANAVSKLWNDAPIVICGDFNCTPKSPMYNFIKEKELDLSELARDMISGQASAQIGLPRPTYPDFRAQGTDIISTASAVNSEKLEQGHFPTDAQSLSSPHRPTDAPLKESCSQPGSSDLANTSESCPNEEGECVESDSQTLSEIPNKHIEPQCSSASHSNDLSETSTNNSGSSQLEGPSKNVGDTTLSKHVTIAVSNSTSTWNNTTFNMHISCESTSSDNIPDEKFEGLSLDEVVGDAGHKVAEDCESFLSELHSSGQSPFSTERDSGPPFQKLHNHGEGILNQDFNQESVFAMDNPSFNPLAWTPEEIEIATGSMNCKVMKHPLKLTSAYTEVKSSPELRDSSGEPFVTSYHRRFSGTVDYIWHSQGVETVKVLAPIAKHVMHQTAGFPTKKWGSDHIALVSEFAFTKDPSSETPKQ